MLKLKKPHTQAVTDPGLPHDRVRNVETRVFLVLKGTM